MRRLADMHPIAKVSLSQILGLVEAVDEMGGSADAATIGQEFDMDLDRLGPVVDAAEFLGLLSVGDGDLKTTDLSQKVLAANQKQRKAIIRDIIEDVPVFRQITSMVRQAGRPLGRQEVLEALAAQVGTHQSEDFFKALVYWGRYVELVTYDSESEELSLRVPSS